MAVTRVSKHDTQFFNHFSMVIGILVTIAILLIALSKVVGADNQLQHLKTESMQLAAVDQRTRPFARTAVAGQDNAALEIVEQAADAGAAPALPAPKNGEEVYNTACHTCHAQGIAGAPRIGDKAAWAPRIAKGMDTLHKHSIEGFQGQAGVMPPKGGFVQIPDDLIRQGVDYMVDRSR